VIDKNNVSRKCIVTREIFCKSELIRFVVGPDNNLYPDINNKLDGKGIWVKSQKSLLQKAISSNLFAKTMGNSVTIAPHTIDLVNNLLKQKCFDILGLCNKAGVVITGCEKVDHLLKKNNDNIYLKACDSNAKHVTKNNAYCIFTGDELSRIMGKDNVIHVAIKSCGLTVKLIESLKRFISYNEIEG
jgi:uncharacterized protein